MKLIAGSQKISIASIDIAERLRPLNQVWVDAFAEQISNGAELPAIWVGKVGRRHRLIAGLHRLKAQEAEGAKTIRADIFEAESDDPEAEFLQAEADENLFDNTLCALDRAVHLAKRKEAHERLHPETRRGVAGGKARQGSASDNLSFATETSEKIGLSERAIQRSVRIAEGLTAETIERLAGSWLADNQSQLEALAELPEPKQDKAVGVLLDVDGPRNVKLAKAIVDGEHVPAAVSEADRLYDRLVGTWARAPEAARRPFLKQLEKEGVVQIVKKGGRR